MQNKRRQALAERVFKVAGDYKKVSCATLKLGRTAFETDEIRRFRERVNEYSRALSSAASDISGGRGSLTSAEVKAEKYLGRILSENYEVMIYDGEIGEELLEILGGNILHKGVKTK